MYSIPKLKKYIRGTIQIYFGIGPTKFSYLNKDSREYAQGLLDVASEAILSLRMLWESSIVTFLYFATQ